MTISQRQSDFLNLTRWVAAWFVVAEHVRALVFADFEGNSVNSLWIPFYLLTGFGHEAVMIFFVISGYLVGGKVWERYRQRRFRWTPYFCDRLSRLYAVLLAALAIGFAFDFIGLHYFNDFGQYTYETKTPMALVTRDFSESLQVGDLFANLCFLQTVTTPPFGSNGPLWSLANEWWYYILFPLSVAVVLDSRWTIRIVSLLALTALIVWLPGPLVVLSGVWLMGVVTGALQRPLLPCWVASILAAIALVVARLDWLPVPLVGQYAIGITFALLVNSMAGSSHRFPFHALSFRLADFSYSLYLLHLPLALLCVSVVHHYSGVGFKLPPGRSSATLFLAVFVFTVLFSWIVSLVTERRTAAIRRLCYQGLGITSKRNSAVSTAPPVGDLASLTTHRRSASGKPTS